MYSENPPVRLKVTLTEARHGGAASVSQRLGQPEVVCRYPGVPDSPQPLHGVEVLRYARDPSDGHQGATERLESKVCPGQGEAVQLSPELAVVELTRAVISEALAGLINNGALAVEMCVTSNREEHSLKLYTAVTLPRRQHGRDDALHTHIMYNILEAASEVTPVQTEEAQCYWSCPPRSTPPHCSGWRRWCTSCRGGRCSRRSAPGCHCRSLAASGQRGKEACALPT